MNQVIHFRPLQPHQAAIKHIATQRNSTQTDAVRWIIDDWLRVTAILTLLASKSFNTNLTTLLNLYQQGLTAELTNEYNEDQPQSK